MRIEKEEERLEAAMKKLLEVCNTIAQEYGLAGFRVVGAIERWQLGVPSTMAPEGLRLSAHTVGRKGRRWHSDSIIKALRRVGEGDPMEDAVEDVSTRTKEVVHDGWSNEELEVATIIEELVTEVFGDAVDRTTLEQVARYVLRKVAAATVT